MRAGIDTAIFVSDLHLAPERPDITSAFFRFLENVAPGHTDLFILGDLFEYWLGDDDVDDPLATEVARRLSALGPGTSVRIMQGNRDVLLGNDYAIRCGAALMGDPTVVTIGGALTMLTHGDALCIDDLDYQRFRTYARNPDNQRAFLALPMAARRAQIQDMRRRSEQEKSGKPSEIMDVSQSAVAEALRAQRFLRMIHGHTHRPGHHLHTVDGRDCERWVLPDWHTTGGYLECGPGGCRLHEVRLWF
jgi:UDP-2,3-diacylglucosamine hydrolase